MGGLSLLRRAGWRLVLAGLFGAATELAGIALAGTAAWLIVRAADRPPIAALALAIVAVRAFALAKGGLRYAERLAGHDAALRVLADVRTGTYAALQRGGPVAARGDALARLVSDVDGVQDALLRWLVPAAVAGTVGTAAVAFTGFLAPAAAVVLTVGLLVGGVLLPWLGYSRSHRTLRRVAGARGDATAAVVDVVHGIADLTAYGALPAALATAGARSGEVARLERRAGAVSAVVGGLAAAVPGLTAIAVALTVGGVRGTVLALVALTAVEAAVPLAAAAVRHAELRGALSRVAALADDVPPAPAPSDAPNPIPNPTLSPAPHGTPPVPAPEGPVVPRLRLTGGRVTYRGGGPPALDDVDLDLPPGIRVAVVGPSGSGKSTLLAALCGEAPLAAGSLTVDGVAGVPTGWPLTGGVFADAHMFHASVRDNLTLGRAHLTDAVLADALIAAGLPDWTDRLDDIVGEDGARASGGQRQRLLLARALAEPPPVLLLDEPTEGLDPAAADAVLADALRAAGTRTVVVVTHRYAGLAAFDEVITLDAGRRSTADEPPIREVPEAVAGGGVRT